MKRTIALFMAIGVIFTVAVSAQKRSNVFSTSGNYDGIEMTSKESGDYGGVSVYLVQSASDTYALVKRAEGVVMEPRLVKAVVSGKDMRTISFTVPGNDGGEGQKYRGKVSAAGFKLDKGTEAEGLSGGGAMLKRTCSFEKTYSNISVSKESGDTGGMEVFLTDADGQWFAVVSLAEGEMGEPVLVEAKVTGKNFDQVEFPIVNGDGSTRTFKGSISKAGVLTLKDQDGSRIVLKPKCYK